MNNHGPILGMSLRAGRSCAFFWAFLALLPFGSIPRMSAAPGTSSPPSPYPEQAQAPNPAPPVPTEARRMALDAAGAFVNEGFRIRDAEWAGSLTKGTPVFLQLSLFAGEGYWFVAATPTLGARLRVTLYDAQGKPLKTEQWKDDGQGAGARGAAGVAPDQSGKYFVSVELTESPSGLPADFSLVYAYK